jgi:hypothetical protein
MLNKEFVAAFVFFFAPLRDIGRIAGQTLKCATQAQLNSSTRAGYKIKKASHKQGFKFYILSSTF